MRNGYRYMHSILLNLWLIRKVERYGKISKKVQCGLRMTKGASTGHQRARNYPPWSMGVPTAKPNSESNSAAISAANTNNLIQAIYAALTFVLVSTSILAIFLSRKQSENGCYPDYCVTMRCYKTPLQHQSLCP
jgi:hypothetical protein